MLIKNEHFRLILCQVFIFEHKEIPAKIFSFFFKSFDESNVIFHEKSLEI
jgi:hypothetical protein